MKSSIKKLFVLATTAFLPVISFAQVMVTTTQSNQASNPLFRLIDLFMRILKIAMPVLLAILAILVVINIIKFVTSDDSLKEGLKEKMAKSFIGLFLALALFGVVHLISNVLGIGVGGKVSDEMIPQVVVPMY